MLHYFCHLIKLYLHLIVQRQFIPNYKTSTFVSYFTKYVRFSYHLFVRCQVCSNDNVRSNFVDFVAFAMNSVKCCIQRCFFFRNKQNLINAVISVITWHSSSKDFIRHTCWRNWISWICITIHFRRTIAQHRYFFCPLKNNFSTVFNRFRSYQIVRSRPLTVNWVINRNYAF